MYLVLIYFLFSPGVFLVKTISADQWQQEVTRHQEQLLPAPDKTVVEVHIKWLPMV